jgi:cysteinyl-tRNA synthetase
MTEVKIKNTLTKQKEEFRPVKEGRVLFYHCGPTVYWSQHIGNLRGMTCGDLIIRSLRYLGYEVVHVRNYTDVGHLTSDEDEGEDKMEKSARKEKKDPLEIADIYIKKFEQDVNALNLEEPTYKPRATEHIKEMQEMTQILLDKGYAYITELAVYFDVSKFDRYGELAGQKLEDKKSGAGTGEVTDPEKRNPQDFALWFFKAGAHKNALQTWESPFESGAVKNGEGFPGWHIECSAMSKKYLGDTLDIHMGGVEHIPIHHTNEIAQSEAANDVEFVKYWLHNEHLMVNDNKMAKSEGTGITLDDVVERIGDPMVLRYFFLQAHYRSKQNFTEEAIENAKNEFRSLQNRVRNIAGNIANKTAGSVHEEYKRRFTEALADDFNTPEALATTMEMLKSDISAEDKLTTLNDFDKVLGLSQKTGFSVDDFTAQVTSQGEYAVFKGFEGDVPEEIVRKAEQREKLRKEKNFVEADRLRDDIRQQGYIIEDGKDGPIIYKD